MELKLAATVVSPAVITPTSLLRSVVFNAPLLPRAKCKRLLRCWFCQLFQLHQLLHLDGLRSGAPARGQAWKKSRWSENFQAIVLNKSIVAAWLLNLTVAFSLSLPVTERMLTGTVEPNVIGVGSNLYKWGAHFPALCVGKNFLDCAPTVYDGQGLQASRTLPSKCPKFLQCYLTLCQLLCKRWVFYSLY